MSDTLEVTELRPGADENDPRIRAAARHAKEFLRLLGVDDEPGLRGSPVRMARAYAELLTPTSFTATTFANHEDFHGLVVVRDLPVVSVCEHHLLPFFGVAHLGYLPGDRLLGLSKFARLVDQLSRRPQVQERLTGQVARWLEDTLAPWGVGVVIEAEHTCMTLRGIRAGGSRTRTTAFSGILADDPDVRADFLAGLPRAGGELR